MYRATTRGFYKHQRNIRILSAENRCQPSLGGFNVSAKKGKFRKCSLTVFPQTYDPKLENYAVATSPYYWICAFRALPLPRRPEFAEGVLAQRARSTNQLNRYLATYSTSLIGTSLIGTSYIGTCITA